MAILGRPDLSTVMPDFWAGKEDARARGYNFLPTPFSPSFLFSPFFLIRFLRRFEHEPIQKTLFYFLRISAGQ